MSVFLMINPLISLINKHLDESDHDLARSRINTSQWWCGINPKTSPYLWVIYNELTASSLEIIVSKGNHPQMALIQVSDL